MPEKTTYTRKIPEPQAWQNKQRSTSLPSPRVIPSAPHNVETIKVPELPRTTQTLHTINASVPSKPAGGDMAISPQKSERHHESISMHAPKTVKASTKINPTISTIPKQVQSLKMPLYRSEASSALSLKIKPKTQTKAKSSIVIPEVPQTPEQEHYAKAMADQEKVKQFVLRRAALELRKIRDEGHENSEWWNNRLAELAEIYNQTSRAPKYTYDEVKKEVDNEIFGNANIIDKFLDKLPSIPDFETFKSKFKDSLLKLGKASLIATIPAFMAGIQLETASPEQRVKDAGNEAFTKIWESYAPPALRGIFDVGDVTEFANGIKLEDYISADYPDKLKKALDNTLTNTKAIIGAIRGTTPDTMDKTIQAYKTNYLVNSNLPFSEKMNAIRYIAGREFVNNFLGLLPRRVGAVSLNTPRLQEGLYSLVSTGVSPEARIFAEELRNMGITQQRVSAPKSFYEEKPRIRLTPTQVQDALGVKDVSYRRGTNLAGDIPMPELDPVAFDRAKKDHTYKQYIETAKKLRSEFEYASRVRENARLKVEETQKDYDSAKAHREYWVKEFDKYESQENGKSIIPKTQEEIRMAENARLHMEATKAALDEATKRYEEADKNYYVKQEESFWAIMKANEYGATGRVDNPDYKEAAKKLYDAKYNSRTIEAINKDIKDHEDKIQQFEWEKERLKAKKFFALGTPDWPIDSKNQLTSVNWNHSGNKENFGFKRDKGIVLKIASDPQKLKNVFEDIKKYELINKDYYGGSWYPKIADELAKGKGNINVTELAEKHLGSSSGDGTIDFARLVDDVYYTIPDSIRQNFLITSGVREETKELYNAIHNLLYWYDGRVKAAKVSPTLTGDPSYDPEKEKKLKEKLNGIDAQIANERKAISHMENIEKNQLKTAKENMIKLYELKQVPFDVNKVFLQTGIKSFSLNDVFKKAGDTALSIATHLDKNALGYGLGTAGAILGGELIGKMLGKSNDKSLNNPNRIETKPYVDSAFLPGVERFDRDVKEYTNNQLRDIIQNYFIERNQRPEVNQSENNNPRGSLGDTINNALDSARESLQNFGNSAQNIGNKIGNGIGSAFNQAQNIGSSLSAKVKNVGSKIGSTFSQIKNRASQVKDKFHEQGVELSMHSNDFAHRLLNKDDDVPYDGYNYYEMESDDDGEDVKIEDVKRKDDKKRKRHESMKNNDDEERLDMSEDGNEFEIRKQPKAQPNAQQQNSQWVRDFNRMYPNGVL